jgi:hypothetical protein
VEVDQGPPFVSRGGEKLEAALATFYIDVHGWVCADVGALDRRLPTASCRTAPGLCH